MQLVLAWSCLRLSKCVVTDRLAWNASWHSFIPWASLLLLLMLAQTLSYSGSSLEWTASLRRKPQAQMNLILKQALSELEELLTMNSTFNISRDIPAPRVSLWGALQLCSTHRHKHAGPAPLLGPSQLVFYRGKILTEKHLTENRL